MNTNWDLVMCVIRTIEKREYMIEMKGMKDYLYIKNKKGVWETTKLHDHDKNYLKFRENFIIKSMRSEGWGHKEKKEYLKMNKIKGYSKCNNHRQLNKLMMSF
jgi:hypothetical protein